MASAQKIVPLTCHGHSRPVTHLNFSEMVNETDYYLISGCKDNHPMLRDGMTGDWIGTFLGHKGAVWQARMSEDAQYAVTGSADFTAKIWDPHTGEALATLQHNHIVRAVCFMPGDKPSLVATGGFEKQLRIFDLGKTSSGDPLSPESATAPPKPAAPSYEIGAGVHQAAIKSIIWGPDRNVLISAADDKVVRWWDIRTHSQPIKTFTLEGPLGSCEMNTLTNPIGSSRSTISVAAGKSAYFFSSTKPADLEAVHKTQHEIASVAVNTMDEKFVTGGSGDTWVRVYDFQTGKELNIYKGHHGPVWSTAFSPDGKICATGSEDGTIKLWKFANDAYGLWR